LSPVQDSTPTPQPSDPGTIPPGQGYDSGNPGSCGDSGDQFRWPFDKNYTISSGYGMRLHPIDNVWKLHKGLDISAPSGASILACADGTVSFVGWENSANHSQGWGYYIKIKHDSTYSTLYAHTSSATVSSGQNVSRGQVIGYVGSTGAATGPHLHLELWKNGVASEEVNNIHYA